MRAIAITASALILAGCATSKGNERHAQHGADQIRMIAVQREARIKEQEAQAREKVALVEALAEVAKANPDHAPSVAVALAVIGVQGEQSAAMMPRFLACNSNPTRRWSGQRHSRLLLAHWLAA